MGRNPAPASTIKQRLLTSADAARMLGVKPATFRDRVLRGLAPRPFARMGNLFYYRLADVEHFCDRGTWPPGMDFRAQGDPGA